ncbi:MAG: DMT family transporter, partial [bacterium]
MILYTYPTFVTLFGLWLFKIRVTGLTWIALIISYAGIGLIFLHDLNFYGTEVIRGALWIIASAVCFSLYLLFSKSLIQQLGSILFTCIAMGGATLAISLHYVLVNFVFSGSEMHHSVPNHSALGLILLMSIACTVIPSFMISAAIARIGASSTGIAGTFGPAMTAVFAVLLIGERFTVYHLIGTVLVVSAISLIALKRTDGQRN